MELPQVILSCPAEDVSVVKLIGQRLSRVLGTVTSPDEAKDEWKCEIRTHYYVAEICIKVVSIASSSLSKDNVEAYCWVFDMSNVENVDVSIEKYLETEVTDVHNIPLHFVVIVIPPDLYAHQEAVDLLAPLKQWSSRRNVELLVLENEEMKEDAPLEPRPLLRKIDAAEDELWEGWQRWAEALQCHHWPSMRRLETKKKETSQITATSSFSPVWQKSSSNETEYQMEEYEQLFEDIQKFRLSSKPMSDEERRERATGLALRFATLLDVGEELSALD